MTDEQKRNAEEMREALVARGINPNLHEGLILYHLKGVRPGDFLTAVLSNDLKGAFARGDEESLKTLPSLVKFLYNKCPAGMWGSPDRVSAWDGCEYYGGR